MSNSSMTWKHWALVAGVGGLLGVVFKRASPAIFGAALYGLGFYIGRRPQTQALLDRYAAQIPGPTLIRLPDGTVVQQIPIAPSVPVVQVAPTVVPAAQG
jgi:hypothetical protein